MKTQFFWAFLPARRRPQCHSPLEADRARTARTTEKKHHSSQKRVRAKRGLGRMPDAASSKHDSRGLEVQSGKVGSRSQAFSVLSILSSLINGRTAAQLVSPQRRKL
jgi:hypothetical protein